MGGEGEGEYCTPEIFYPQNVPMTWIGSILTFTVQSAWKVSTAILGGSGGVVNSLDFCPASLRSLGRFYFQCVLSSQCNRRRRR